MRRAHAYLVVALAAAVPRAAALLVERGTILEEFTEKSDDFARTLVASGTFGFVPGEPSAYTQPLYGWFLAGLYWAFDRHWAVVGTAQIAVAVATALLVYEIGRRWISPRVGVVAAVIATLSPYLVWHDVHVNREVLDGLLAAALVLLTLLAADRRSAWLAGAAGVVAGLAVLGNARLAALPLVLGLFLLWRRTGLVPFAALLAGAALAVTPWVARNAVVVGCAAITTDARALWKANNPHTDEVLAAGGWIDDVPPIPGTPPTPEDAGAIHRAQGRVVEIDECEQSAFYQERVLEFWAEHPGEKAELALRGTAMLWDPRVTRTEGGPGAGGLRDLVRTWVAPLYFVPLFLLGLLGLRFVPWRLAVLAVAILAYVTLTAAVFVGATRYRVPYDFLLALPAAAFLERLRAAP